MNYHCLVYFSTIRKFCVAVTKKMLAKFPFGDQTLKNMAFLSPQFTHNLDSNCGE